MDDVQNRHQNVIFSAPIELFCIGIITISIQERQFCLLTSPVIHKCSSSLKIIFQYNLKSFGICSGARISELPLLPMVNRRPIMQSRQLDGHCYPLNFGFTCMKFIHSQLEWKLHYFSLRCYANLVQVMTLSCIFSIYLISYYSL